MVMTDGKSDTSGCLFATSNPPAAAPAILLACPGTSMSRTSRFTVSHHSCAAMVRRRMCVEAAQLSCSIAMDPWVSSTTESPPAWCVQVVCAENDN